MKTRARRIGFVFALGATAACSLTVDLSGFSEPEAADAALLDAQPDVGLADAVGDAAPDVLLPPCKAANVIDAPLTVDLGTFSPRTKANNGYPKVEPFFGMPAAVLMPFVDTTPIPIDAGPDADAEAGTTFFMPPERTSAVGGIWQTTPVALSSFDVELEVQVRCTSGTSCADGMAFAWLDATDVDVLKNANTLSGGALGLPKAVSGGAVFVDDFRNPSDESSDPPVPALQIVKIDRTKVPGQYPWVIASSETSFLDGWHKVSISVRGGAVTVRYDGQVKTSATLPSFARGLVGITAGTGGETDAVAVRNFKGSFYDCAP